MSVDAREVPIDPTTEARLSDRGLRGRVVPQDDDAAVGHFLRAVARGFMDEDPNDEQLGGARESIREQRRMVAVYDDGAVVPESPVGTIDSWLTDLTVDVDRTIAMWAISGVTVAPTHRRRGIASALIRGELASAANAGLAIAGLTVSETTIYGRYGFAPAVNTTSWELTTSRAKWVRPTPSSRLDFVDRDTLAEDLGTVHDRVREREPARSRLARHVAPDRGHGSWRENRKVRGIRYTDESGVVRGVAAYTLKPSGEEWAGQIMEVEHVNADGPDAYAALWRFLLEHDLVGTVKAYLRGQDEPLWWMIADQRGVSVTARDHEWLRILDVPVALAARNYRAAGDVVVRVEDPLGYAEGTWRLTVDDAGAATVEPSDASPAVTLPVTALSAIYVGGVSPLTLTEAALIEGDADAIAWLAQTFAPLAPPRCTIWY